MKTLKDFDYNLWTTEENGIKKYYVRTKTTGEVTEVDAGVMRLLRSEEKKMRRYIKEKTYSARPCRWIVIRMKQLKEPGWLIHMI